MNDFARNFCVKINSNEYNGYIQKQNSHSYTTQTRVSIPQVWLVWG